MVMDSGMKQILLSHCYNLKVMYLLQFRISVDFFLLGPAENSCQEWTVAKEDTVTTRNNIRASRVVALYSMSVKTRLA
jgi:hypothetical protein